MDTLLKLHIQDPSGTTLKDHLDEADSGLDSQDQVLLDAICMLKNSLH
jgi:hypothetical protein